MTTRRNGHNNDKKTRSAASLPLTDLRLFLFLLLLLLLLLCTAIRCVVVVTAETVEYTWHVRPRRSRPPLSPDCFIDRDLLLVNDLNPGPEIRANVGDTVRITIINHASTEAISIHYHGLHMQGEPYQDGTGTMSQCSLGPMQTLVTEFVAREVGTHYWHGHTSLDRLDGLQGAIVIEDPDDEDEREVRDMYDEERVVFLQDWYHRSGPSCRTGLDSEPFIWIGNAQSFLINGLGRFQGCLDGSISPTLCDPNCTTPEDNYLASIDVEQGKTYRLRIINAASLVAVNFAVAGHNLTIVEADGTLTDPVTLSNLDITVAQRYSVLLTANQTPGSYWATTSIRWRDAGPMGLAYLNYGDSAPPDATDDPMPEHPAWDDTEVGPALDAMLFTRNVEAYDDADDVLTDDPDAVDRRLIVVGTQVRQPSGEGLLRWTANNISQHFPATPLILQAYQAVHAEGAAPWPNTVIPDAFVVPDTPPVTWDYTQTLQDAGVSTFNAGTGTAIMKLVRDDAVELVLQNARALNGVAELHSWHLHGHSFWIVGQGTGTFDPNTDPANYTLNNPLRRDTVSVWPLGWTAIRFKADNVGVWPFHCAMTAHAVMGMGYSFVTSPDLLPPPPPGVEGCIKTSLNVSDAETCSKRDGNLLENEGDDSGDDSSGSVVFHNLSYWKHLFLLIVAVGSLEWF